MRGFFMFKSFGRFPEVTLRFTRGRVENPELASGLFATSPRSFLLVGLQSRTRFGTFSFFPNAGVTFKLGLHHLKINLIKNV